MKTTLSLVSVVLGVTAVFTASASPQNRPALSHPVNAVERTSCDTIMRGSTNIEVLNALGVPMRKLSPTVWAYPHFNGGDAQAADDDCSVLLVTFNKDVVTELRLVNPRAEAIIAAQFAAPREDKGMYATLPERKP